MRPLRAALLLALLGACQGTSPAPEAIERVLPGQGAPSGGLAEEDEDTTDAGPPQVDAGVCCMVQFALAARPEEVSARLIVGGGLAAHAMTLDGGTWSAESCMPLVDSFYFFETDVPSADDAGVFVAERINESVPYAMGSYITVFNLFSASEAMSCETLDAGSYGLLGTSDGGL